MIYLVLASLPMMAMSICPGLYEGTPINNYSPIPPLTEYNKELKDLNIEDVFDDLEDLLTDSHECWPADSFPSEDDANYGGLFIRLSWHCSGSFRDTDGVGGCSGGRQRFWPEASWDDNTNLDKARALLAPIKNKYGVALSWGDLMVFAGTAAIRSMGGPVGEMCAGRIDDANGSASEPLGPGPEAPPCQIQGDCQPPLGADTIGLIYVNPEGFMGEPDPLRSARQIRDVFGRMGMDDRKTVALIGGGHAFGKSHGACPFGAGPPPDVQPLNPWPGNCGTGKGLDTYTSGIEGQWTTYPFTWDNEFFELLVNDEYKLIKGPGDKWQWENEDKHYLMMLTTDLALVADEDYKEIVEEFADDIDSLDQTFSEAWKQLVEDGSNWADEKHCVDFGGYSRRGSYGDSSSSSSSWSSSVGSSSGSSSSYDNGFVAPVKKLDKTGKF